MQFVSFAHMRRFAAQQREIQLRLVARAAQAVANGQEPKDNPDDINAARWAAMIQHVLNNGTRHL